MSNIAIIGAGMAGFMAAIFAAKKGNQVTIYEQKELPAKKLYLTGNGKCNLSNKSVEASDYVTDDVERLMHILHTYREQESQILEQMGLLCKEKNGGIYPVSNQAATVVKVLNRQAKACGIHIKCNVRCEGIRPLVEGGYELMLKNTASDAAFQKNYQKVILSCGGLAGVYQELSNNGYGLSKSLGILHFPCYPALVQTKCRGGLAALAGVRQDARARLYIEGNEMSYESGEIQFTAQGLSGIPIFQLTLRMGQALREKKAVKIILDLLPAFTYAKLEEILEKAILHYPKCSIQELLDGFLHEKLLAYLFSQQGFTGEEVGSSLTKAQIEELLTRIKNLEFDIKELNPFKNAQISTGGVSLTAIDEFCQVKEFEGLYICGEMLNVAGKCGGYNLLFAAASGYMAGTHIRKTT